MGVKKLLFIALLAMLTLIGCQPRVVDSYYTQEKPKKPVSLAIVDFIYEVEPGLGVSLAADLRRELAVSKRFPLVEQAVLNEALRESHLSSAAYLEPAAARLLGQRLKTELILTGRIVDFHLEEKVTDVPLLWSATQYTATYKSEICLIRTSQKKQVTQEVTGQASLLRRELQLFYLGGERENFQFISAQEKQRLIEAAYDNLRENILKVVASI